MFLLNGRIDLPLDIYSEQLENINGIRFTPREIDVIACILNGRSAKTIPSLLSISAKTVATHLANIRAKISYSSSESIIDFMEKSDRLPVLKHKYYLSLLALVFFEKKIKGLCKESTSCIVAHDPAKVIFFNQLKQHLELVGFKIKTQVDTEHKNYILVQDASEAIPLSTDDNYYASFFTILKRLLPHQDMDKMFQDFEAYCNGLDEPVNKELTPEYVATTSLRKYQIMGLGLVCCILIFAGFIWNIAGPNSDGVRSDLILPSETTLVNRSELMAQIDKELNKQKGIHSVAIVGIGGAGKTTLARKYAKRFKGCLLWEINSETQGSLLQSFEGLADALSVTEEDKKILRGLQDIKDAAEKQDKIIAFVRERLRSHPDWLLIYDNVETYKDVEKYFPHDASLWGTGKVVVTTRNATIQNMNAVVPIGELSPGQKLELFTQIMQQGTTIKFDPTQAEGFLKEIPPFPLDVSLAAYYIKSTNISYEKYIETLNANEEGFSGLQENILNESGSYNKTRYKIIALTIQKLIREHKEFRDLFLLVGLMDSQNIPKELLDRFKGDQSVNAFMYHLKKHSLITDGTLSTPAEPTFSIHRSTQKIILDYLSPAVELEVINSISTALDSLATLTSYQEDFTKSRILIGHCERMLERDDLISGENWVLIAQGLGWLYYCVGQYVEATKILESCLDILIADGRYNNSLLSAHVQHSLGTVYMETKEYNKADKLLNQSLILFRKIKGENHELVAANLQHLGMRALHVGKYEYGKELLENAKHILTVYYPTNFIDIARVGSRLGEVNRELGNYNDARKVLEESLMLYKKCLEKDHYRIGQAQARLGVVYKEIGEYEKAKELLQQALVIYKKYFPSNSDKVIRLAYKLGPVECELGHLEAALKILEESHAMYTSFYSDDFRLGCIKLYLGQVYMAKGDLEKARTLFEQSLARYEENYGIDHKDTAQVIRSLGKLHCLQGDPETGEALLQKSLSICQASNHPQAFMDLEMLGEIYLQRSQLAENKEKVQELRRASLSYFKQALEILKTQFPQDSPHLKRIQSTVNKLEQ
jgi:tetratricopeptide (TPR) repeat protein/DNA-binding CsgD family transcriptional regulator